MFILNLYILNILNIYFLSDLFSFLYYFFIEKRICSHTVQSHILLRYYSCIYILYIYFYYKVSMYSYMEMINMIEIYRKTNGN